MNTIAGTVMTSHDDPNRTSDERHAAWSGLSVGRLEFWRT
jgi:hypothetical protein